MVLERSFAHYESLKYDNLMNLCAVPKIHVVCCIYAPVQHTLVCRSHSSDSVGGGGAEDEAIRRGCEGRQQDEQRPHVLQQTTTTGEKVREKKFTGSEFL